MQSFFKSSMLFERLIRSDCGQFPQHRRSNESGIFDSLDPQRRFGRVFRRAAKGFDDRYGIVFHNAAEKLGGF